MTAGRQLPGVEQLVAAFHGFRYSVFRLETLQVYAGSGEDQGIAAFQRGDPQPPPDPAEDEWAALLRVHRDAGRVQQRVHVVTEPITDYLAYELTWEYGPHTAAGEDIRIIPVTGRWPDDVPWSDFTLFDSRLLFRLNYDPEELGWARNWSPTPRPWLRPVSLVMLHCTKPCPGPSTLPAIQIWSGGCRREPDCVAAEGSPQRTSRRSTAPLARHLPQLT